MRSSRFCFAALALTLGACGHAAAPPIHLVSVASTTTTTATPVPTTVTTVLPLAHPTRPPAPSRIRAPQYATSLDDAFWRRLANCESRYGASGMFVGYFQLTWANAARVGISPSSSYEEQKAGAITWLGLIGGRGWTTAGWPTCWPIAIRG